MTEPFEDFHDAIMRAPEGGGVSDDIGWLGLDGLQQMAQEGTQALLSAGLIPQEPVLVPVGGRAEDVAAILAVIGAGGTAVPLHCKTHPATRAQLETATGARLAFVPTEATRRAVPEVTRRASAPPTSRDLLDGAAMITFTSGSTGTPKGVVLSRSRISAKLAAIRAEIGMEGGPETAVPLQLQFSFGQWATFLPLMLGGRVHMTARFSPDWAEHLLSGHPLTHFAAVPTMLRMLGKGTPCVRPLNFLTGGEAVSADLRAAVFSRWPAATIHGIYGLTETGTCDLFRRDRASDRSQSTTNTGNSLGRPAPGVGVATDPQTSELLIRSPYSMLGYLDRPDLTRDTLQDGWIRTGDLGLIAPDGEVFLRGRLKELINRGGNKVSPLEVEAVFAKHPAVRATLATGVPDPRFGEAIHLLVVPRDGAMLGAEALLAWARDRIDRFKLPDAVHFAAALPLGATGKADRTALRRSISAAAAT